jgi:hypothetical protein
MARQSDTCWNCGAEWAPGAVTRTKLRVAPVAGIDRWANEGGHAAPDAVVPVALAGP